MCLLTLSEVLAGSLPSLEELALPLCVCPKLQFTSCQVAITKPLCSASESQKLQTSKEYRAPEWKQDLYLVQTFSICCKLTWWTFVFKFTCISSIAIAVWKQDYAEMVVLLLKWLLNTETHQPVGPVKKVLHCAHWSHRALLSLITATLHCRAPPDSIHNNESYSDSWTCGRVNLLAATKNN